MDRSYGGVAYWVECWQCGGEGEMAHCFEEFACIDPEYGCEDCIEPCDICNGAGGWERPATPPLHQRRE